MLLDSVQAQREAILTLAKQFGARHIRIFGSVARGEEREDSDVDFLVEFDRGYDLFSQRLPLTAALSELLNRRIDLIPEHELNQHIKEQVLKESVEL